MLIMKTHSIAVLFVVCMGGLFSIESLHAQDFWSVHWLPHACRVPDLILLRMLFQSEKISVVCGPRQPERRACPKDDLPCEENFVHGQVRSRRRNRNPIPHFDFESASVVFASTEDYIRQPLRSV